MMGTLHVLILNREVERGHIVGWQLVGDGSLEVQTSDTTITIREGEIDAFCHGLAVAG